MKNLKGVSASAHTGFWLAMVMLMLLIIKYC